MYQQNSDLWYALQQQGHNVQLLDLSNPLQNIRIAARQLDIDIFIIDRNLQFDNIDYPPFYLISQIRTVNIVTPIIACSYYFDEQSIEMAYRYGATVYFTRPAHLYNLLPLIRSLAYRRLLIGDLNIKATQQFEFGHFILNIATETLAYTGDAPLVSKNAQLFTDNIVALTSEELYALRYLLSSKNNAIPRRRACIDLMQRNDDYTNRRLSKVINSLIRLFNCDPENTVRIIHSQFFVGLMIADMTLSSKYRSWLLKRDTKEALNKALQEAVNADLELTKEIEGE